MTIMKIVTANMLQMQVLMDANKALLSELKQVREDAKNSEKVLLDKLKELETVITNNQKVLQDEIIMYSVGYNKFTII